MFIKLSQSTVLLFVLNFLDAVLTIYWVRNGFATEGNQLMAELLDIGNAPFLMVKLGVGALAAVVLWHWGNLRVARYGLSLVLTIYISLMGVHLITGLSAFGVISEAAVNNFSGWMKGVFAFIN